MFTAFYRLRWIAVCLLGACLPVLVQAQRDQREPLTAQQQDQIAEAGIDPDARIGLYTKFLNEHASTLEAVGKRRESGRGKRLDGELQDFSSLIDELASNLDEYGDRKADIRKSLKSLNDSLPHWKEILAALPKDPVSDVARDDATDALNDLSDQARKITADLDDYFKAHKDAKGQEREEPH